MSLFKYKNHSNYLESRLEKGTKSEFSKYIGIQPSFLSQVLSQKFSLSCEQAILTNKYFEHNIVESDYFINLVSRDRAGSESLKKYYSVKINEILSNQRRVTGALGQKIELNNDFKAEYYSSWVYAAVHICCFIAESRTVESISTKLKIPQKKTKEILNFLVKAQLIDLKGTNYNPTENWIRLDKSSIFIGRHHSNWRIKSIENFDKQTEEDLHFSGVYSVDQEVVENIREEFLVFLKQQQKKIEKSESKKLICINIDLFEIG